MFAARASEAFAVGENIDAVPSRFQLGDQIRDVRGRPPDVGRVDTRHDQDVHRELSAPIEARTAKILGRLISGILVCSGEHRTFKWSSFPRPRLQFRHLRKLTHWLRLAKRWTHPLATLANQWIEWCSSLSVIDPDDPVLGFVVPQLRALAAHADVTVIANEVRALPASFDIELISLRKEQGYGRARRGTRYELMLGRTLRHDRSAVFAHMCPLYLTLASPIARYHRAPTLLWFVHPANTASLRVAERLADRVLTVFRESYPRSSPKVKAIGHAIDTTRLVLAPVVRDPWAPFRIVALGRTSPVKGFDVMIRALDVARRNGIDATLSIVGPSVTDAENRHRAELVQLASRVAPTAVSIDSGVARSAVANVIHGADALVNATDEGSADKVVFEAMACGRPVLVSSPAFRPLIRGTELPLTFTPGDHDELALRIAALARSSQDTRQRIGRDLRTRIEDDHSLDHWARKVVEEIQALQDRRRWASTGVGGIG